MVVVPADRSCCLAARRPPDDLAGHDDLRRPRRPIRSSPPRLRNPSPAFPPSPRSPAPQNPNPSRPTAGPLAVDSPPARFPSRRRPLHELRGELLLLLVPSARPLSPCSAAAPWHLSRPPLALVAGDAPAANSRRCHDQMVRRVAPPISPLRATAISARIAGLQQHPSSQ
jgi:hypothetical protein